MLESVANQLHHARWIALPDAVVESLPRRSVSTYFRLAFTLPEDRLVTVRVSAADRYRLYVNGQSIHAGPAKGDRWNHFYDTLQLPLLAGENILLARVMWYAPLERTVDHNQVNGPTSVMSFQQEPLFFLESVGEGLELATGYAAWQACWDRATELISCPAAWQGGGVEQYDGSLACANWSTSGGRDWPAAAVRFASGINPFGEISPLILKERPIPSLYQRPLSPIRTQPTRPGEEGLSFADGVATVPAGHMQALELAFDALYTAYIKLRIQSGRGKIRLIYAESYVDEKGEKGVRDDASGRLTGITDVILAAGAPLAWDSFWFRTFRFIRVEVEAETELTLAMPAFLETDYPLPVSTLPTLTPDWADQLWRISLRTLNRCMHETYEDCPYYEQLQYIMDTRLEMLFTYAVGGDTRMARHTLWDFHCSQLPDGMLQSRYPSQYPQVIPVFSLHWIFMLEDYYTQTGDSALLKQYRSTMDGVLDYFDRHIGGSGLVEHLGYWDFGDWTPQWEDRHGVPFAVDAGPCTMHNLCYAQALQAAARMATPMGRPALAADYTARAQTILTGVQAQCYDTGRGLFREGPAVDEYTQHAQILAILTGLVSGGEARALMERTLADSSLIPCSFPWMFNLIRALEAVGLYERADSIIWSVYRDMLKDHLTTVPERPFLVRSDCHAWSALVLYELPRKWLGVHPGQPGWTEIRITPVPCGLSQCAGQVCTPKGSVEVSWMMKDGRYSLSFTAPSVPVRVYLPDGRGFYFPDGGSHIVE